MIIFLCPTKRPAERVSDAVPLAVFKSDTSTSSSSALEPPAPVMVSVDEPWSVDVLFGKVIVTLPEYTAWAGDSIAT